MNDETRQLIQKLRTLEERVAQLEAANLSLSAADILASVQTAVPLLAADNTYTAANVVQSAPIYGRLSTNDALMFFGKDNSGSITMATGTTMTITISGSSPVAVLLINCSGRVGMFVYSYVETGIGMLQGGDNQFELSSTPATNKIGVYKSALSSTISIKSAHTSSRSVAFVLLGGRIVSYTAPA